ncbi:MAG: type II secretion system F family protein [Actinomycetota bacterium]
MNGPLDRVRRTLRTRSESRRAAQQLPDAIDALVLTMHAGLTPHLAVRSIAEHGIDHTAIACASVVGRLERGDALADALHELTATFGPRAAVVADAIGAADRYGTPLAPVLDRLAHEARAERRRLDDAAARKLPVKLSFPLVGCTLPAFVLLAIAPAVLAALGSLGV